MKWTLTSVMALAGVLTHGAAMSPTGAGWLDASVSSVVAEVRMGDEEYGPLLKEAKVSLSEGIALGLKEAKEGVVFKAELEGDKVIHWAVDVAQGTKVLSVDIDARTGKVVETDTESADHSNVVKASKITLAQAIEVALKKVSGGQAVAAELRLDGEKPQAIVKVFAKDKVKTVTVNAETGELVGKKAGSKKDKIAPAFTDTFPVEEGELVSSGRNAYFVLEPGFYQILEGKEDGQDVRNTITVLNETRKIAGVETRVIEDKVWKNGQLAESTRDYYAISKKTSSVYYFGEDVDNYKDGKIDNHDGSWIAGEKGAKFGLMMPGTPLLGSRFYQELAPGVGMDRLEIVSLSETCETPAGKFDRCLKTEETSPLEPGVRDYKLWAPGIGIVEEGGAKLVKYGTSTPK